MNHLFFDSLYSYALLYLSAVSCIFGLSLLVTSFPRHEAYRRYQQARYAIATALFLVSALCFSHWFFQLRDLSAYYSIALNIGVMHLSQALFIMAFASIIRKESVNSKHVERNVIPSLACIVALWGGGFGGSTVRIAAIAVALVVFVVETGRLCLVLRNALSKNKRNEGQGQRLFSDAFIQWIERSMYWGIAAGLMGVAVILLDKKTAVLMLLGFAVFFSHLIVSIFNYAMHFEKDMLGQQSVPLSTVQKKNRKIESELRQWIDDKHYTQSKLTLNDVAHQLNTNRTYLSQYINTVLNIPFGSWLTQLRLEEAKRMLAESPSLGISDVAKACGFSSTSNFSHLFNDMEGMTPQQWINAQNKKGTS